MNDTDRCLQQLFRAAARVPNPLPAEAPFDLEQRVLAAWRGGSAGDAPAFLIPLVRAAVVCACAIVMISAALALRAWTEGPPNELVILDSAIQLTVLK
jgi:hypothetical protein